MVKNKIIGLIFCIISNVIYGQVFDFSLLSKKIFVNTDTISIDTASINPKSFKVYNSKDELQSIEYQLNAAEGQIIFYKIPNDTLIFKYHRLVIDFNKKYLLHPISINRANHQKSFYEPLEISNSQNKKSIFQGTSLNRTGSLSRGLMIGNNQDFSLNSNLNLQLSGMISPTMKILASVTDDNIPIQPQGNTQQLQDFDKVFIQISEEKWNLTAGDFWVKNKEGYFLKYNKRGQGIYVKNKIKGKGNLKVYTENSASTSKGKFGRNVIQGIEGNQGPYSCMVMRMKVLLLYLVELKMFT